MKHKIKGVNDKTLFLYDTDSLKSCLEQAVRSGANLYRANLTRADLSGAYLYRADLGGTYLIGANLYGANLYRANLNRAYLNGARGISKYWTSNLYMLQDQIGKIRAYKLVNKENEGPYNGGIVYTIGKTVSVDKADDNEYTQCSYGISLADLPWCISKWEEGYKILVVEFTAKDIAAIPIGSDGKFRVRKCKVIREKNLTNLGLTKNKQEKK